MVVSINRGSFLLVSFEKDPSYSGSYMYTYIYIDIGALDFSETTMESGR